MRTLSICRFHHPVILFCISLLFLTSAACRSVSSRARPTSPLPPDLAALVEAGDGRAVQELIEQKMRESLGADFPNMSLMTSHGEKLELYRLLKGKPLALFLAGGPCPFTLKWSATLADQGWQAEGYDVLPVVTASPDRDLQRVFRGVSEEVLIVSEWPLPSYLTYVRMYPVMFYISPDGRFIGYQMFGKEAYFLPSSRLEKARTSHG